MKLLHDLIDGEGAEHLKAMIIFTVIGLLVVQLTIFLPLRVRMLEDQVHELQHELEVVNER